MPFVNIDERKSTSKFKKATFADLKTGTHLFRILTKPEDVVQYSTHYVRGVYVKCIGDDCPICLNNKKIIMGNPDNFRADKNYMGKQRKFAVNAYDMTPVVTCPNCGADHKKVEGKFPGKCSECEAMMVDVTPHPMNKVVVIAKGPEFFGDINSLNDSILDEKENPIGVNNFNIRIVVTGSGKTVKYTIIPQDSKEEIPADLELHDLENTVFTLQRDELQDLFNGIALKDILVARKASKQQAEEEESSPISIDADELFKA